MKKLKFFFLSLLVFFVSIFTILFCYTEYLKYVKYKDTQIIKLQGGLGNQLYQVAYGITLEKEYGKKVKYDLRSLRYEKKAKKKRIWVDYYFDKFNIDDLDIYNPNNQIEYLIVRRFLKAKCNKYFYDYDQSCFTKGVYFAEHYFENPKYFEKHMPDIINAFTKLNKKYEYELDDRNKQLIKEMQSHKNSVVVNIRLGDFLVIKELNICNFDYYKKAMNVFNNMEDVHYYIFSDDIEGAKKYFKTNKPHTFVDINPLEKPYLNLILSSNAKHNISSNSTFAIWAAMLNSNPNKIVVCPNLFIKLTDKVHIDIYNYSKQIYPDNWIKIDVSKDKPIQLQEIKTKFNSEFFCKK